MLDWIPPQTMMRSTALILPLVLVGDIDPVELPLEVVRSADERVRGARQRWIRVGENTGGLVENPQGIVPEDLTNFLVLAGFDTGHRGQV